MQFILTIGEWFSVVFTYIATILNCSLPQFLRGLSGVPIGSFRNAYTGAHVNVYNWIPFAESEFSFLKLLGEVFNKFGEIVATFIDGALPFLSDMPIYLVLLVIGCIIIVPYAIWQIIVG